MKNNRQKYPTQEFLTRYFAYCSSGQLFWRDIKEVRRNIRGKEAGCVVHKGYRQITLHNERYYAHTLIYAYHHGEYPKMIDHKDRNPSNNRIDNLRETDYSLNMHNSKQTQSRLGIRGVAHIADCTLRPYRAHIGYQGRLIHIGAFSKLDDAIKARRKAELKYYGGLCK